MDRKGLVTFVSVVVAAIGSNLAGAAGLDAVKWANPPPSSRPWVRWWWPGGAVEDEELRTELDSLTAAGFGGVEIQPLAFALPTDDPRIRTVGDSTFIDHLGVAIAAAHARGLGVALTLGSAWPSGGPFIDAASAEKQLLMSSVDISGPQAVDQALPAPSQPGYVGLTNLLTATPGLPPLLDAFDADVQRVRVVAARLPAATTGSSACSGWQTCTLSQMVDLDDQVDAQGVLHWQVPDGHWRIIALWQNQTRHHTYGDAYPANPPSWVLDTLNPVGAQALVKGLAKPWLDALGGNRPDEVFVDSPELVGELPWTASLLEDFKRQKGYDPTLWLPEVFRVSGESKYVDLLQIGEYRRMLYRDADNIGLRVREDYEDVRSQAFGQGFTTTLARWARQAHTRFRFQAHGGWGEMLDNYGRVDIPESEGLFADGTFDFLKLAASAAHINNRSLVSSESFITFTTDPDRLSLDDLRLLAGRANSAGISRLMAHGYASQYALPDGKRWYPFPNVPKAFTANLHEGNPLWAQLPDFNRMLARVGYALSQGEHQADVAWLLAEDPLDSTWAILPDLFRGPQPGRGESPASRSLRGAGYVYDRISPAQLSAARLTPDGRFQVGQAAFRALVLTDWESANQAAVEAAVRIAEGGIPVVLSGFLPVRARGWGPQHEARDQAIHDAERRLWKSGRLYHALGPGQLGPTLRRAAVAPLLASADPNAEVVFNLEHRHMQEDDLFYLFNESDAGQSQTLQLAQAASSLRWWDPDTGQSHRIASDASGRFVVNLAARRGVVIEASGPSMAVRRKP